MSDINIAAKRALRSKAKNERSERRKQRLKHMRCFWTWPFGHAYTYKQAAQFLECVGCKKRKYTDWY